MAEKKEAEKKPAGSGSTPKVKEKVHEKKEETSAGALENPETGKEEDQEDSYLKDLMAISGQGGLFRFISQGRNGIIVEHLETKKRMQAFATMKVSALEDIAVYTEEEEIKLEEVFNALHKYENGKEAISPKSDNDDLKDYFGAVLPEYDRERVYVSDIKKILGWYNLLLKYDLIQADKPASKAEPEKPATQAAAKKPQEKTAAKKA